MEDILYGEEYLISMGDRTTAIGWLHKARKLDTNKQPQLILKKIRLKRQLADLLIDNKNLLYSQWFPGSTNVILDILSRDWQISDGEILNLLTHCFPTQLQRYF